MDWKKVDKRQLVIILLCALGTFVLSVIRVKVNATTSALGI